jgi:aspartyl-tRNA(Asn)/glutamyl-tRNA(Gln) amidotransferase subunit B
MSQPYTIIVGLETHVQLLTESKLFCGCSTEFGSEPNTQTCPVCIGMPGTLPVMNETAFELSLQTAVALNCEIAEFTKWDRKQYFYPDSPKGYQISQYDLPFSANGWLEISDAKDRFPKKRVRITRAHLEEDAGKSMHDEAHGRGDSRIDLNRVGTPLLEIVSEPDMRSAAEAKAYLTELKLLLTYLGVSDCNMQEGSLRCDANVNLHIDLPDGHIAKTPIVEIKNLNSFRAVERAIQYEAERQYEVWQEKKIQMGQPGGNKSTRGWDDAANETRKQREKEEANDYRYFPDPDLVPNTVAPERVEAIRAALPELPVDLRTRLPVAYGISDADCDMLVNAGPPTMRYFGELVELLGGNGKLACNWITQHVARVLGEREKTLEDIPVSALDLVEVIRKVEAGDFNLNIGRDVLGYMLDQQVTSATAIEKLGIVKVDDSALVALCEELLAANPKVVADVKQGKQQAVMGLIGQAKKKNPNVDPTRIKEICLALIGGM